MYHHVTLFLKSVNTSLPDFSLRDGTIDFIKYAFKILLLGIFSGVLVSTYQNISPILIVLLTSPPEQVTQLKC